MLCVVADADADLGATSRKILCIRTIHTIAGAFRRLRRAASVEHGAYMRLGVASATVLHLLFPVDISNIHKPRQAISKSE